MSRRSSRDNIKVVPKNRIQIFSDIDPEELKNNESEEYLKID